MKKPEKAKDEMRSECQRENLGTLTRGKYAARYAKATNVVVIDKALFKAFPNTEAVNDALRSLLTVGHCCHTHNSSLETDALKAGCRFIGRVAKNKFNLASLISAVENLCPH